MAMNVGDDYNKIIMKINSLSLNLYTRWSYNLVKSCIVAYEVFFVVLFYEDTNMLVETVLIGYVIPMPLRCNFCELLTDCMLLYSIFSFNFFLRERTKCPLRFAMQSKLHRKYKGFLLGYLLTCILSSIYKGIWAINAIKRCGRAGAF